jgi:hypothetical protein
MATGEDIAAIKEFCDAESDLKNLVAAFADRNRQSLLNRNAALEGLMAQMHEDEVECWALPPALHEVGKYVRITQSHSTCAITPTLVQNTLEHVLTADALHEVIVSTGCGVAEAVEEIILKAVRQARTAKKDTVAFSNNKPRKVESIDQAPSAFVQDVVQAHRAKERHELLREEHKAARAPLDSRKQQVVEQVQSYMDRMDRNSQPIIASQQGEKQFLRRKVVTTKAPLLVIQFKEAVVSSIRDVLRHDTPTLHMDDVDERKDRLIQSIVEVMEGLRVHQQKETFTLDAGRKRRRAADSE